MGWVRYMRGVDVNKSAKDSWNYITKVWKKWKNSNQSTKVSSLPRIVLMSFFHLINIFSIGFYYFLMSAMAVVTGSLAVLFAGFFIILIAFIGLFILRAIAP